MQGRRRLQGCGQYVNVRVYEGTVQSHPARPSAQESTLAIQLENTHLATNLINGTHEVDDHGDYGADSWCDLDFAGASAIAA